MRNLEVLEMGCNGDDFCKFLYQFTCNDCDSQCSTTLGLSDENSICYQLGTCRPTN